ncbi:outer membrane protein assembly factor BamA [uncultured Rhodoblastus sp.]|uniref:outer membrane protein assembly factor BamA n=1 Tax=uncultured Rhodoblastus sp. TaxID=543037 RepID=UPI0025D44369|nr:outer membrane protein assembly factor BamA [uncultured Rhodoblastus sp.]
MAVVMIASSVAIPTRASAETILVEGNRNVDADTIRSYFAGGDANEGVKKLYSSGYFSDVQVSRRGNALVVHVVENASTINHVVFVGNSKIKSEDIEKEIQSKAHGGYNQAIVDADVVRIGDMYRRAGRSTATVKARAVETPRGTVDVVFDINEGDKTGIKQIRFVGNRVFSSSKLQGMMETTEMNFLSFIKSSDVYDPDRIAKDAEAIRRYYLKNGYADFRITGTDAEYDPQLGGYILTISLEEGEQYTVGNVQVESHLRDISDASLASEVSVHVGDVYNGNQVEKTVDRITKVLGQRGYAFAQVRPRGDRDPATHTVSIAFVVEEGPRVYIERINVRGNTATRDYVIRREFDIGEGDAYNKALIDKGERRLNSLGYFKKVKITNEAGSAADRVIVDVDVEEQSTGSFSISGGYSTTEGFLAEVSVTQSNFLGKGEYVRLALSVGQYAKGIELNYTEPFFLDQRLAAGFDLYSKLSDASRYAYYSNWVSGGTLRFGIPITDQITLGPRYTLYNSRLSVPNSTSQPYNDCTYPIIGTTPGTPGALPIDTTYGTVSCLTNGEASVALKQASGNWVTSMIGYTLSFNNVDNPRDPHEGIRADLRQDFAGVGGNSQFLRTTVDFRGFHELYFDNLVGIAHVQAGDLQPFGSQPLRIVDNFNLGQSLVRGFAPGGIGPRDITNSTSNNNGNALGGTKYFGASLEAQSPIWGLPKDLGLKLALFADAGTLYDYRGATNFGSYLGYNAGQAASCSYMNNYTPQGAAKQTYAANGVPIQQSACITVGGNDAFAIRSSVGAGLIWASPMGPIRFNYAFVLSKQSSDVTQQFSFSGGANF